MRWLVLLSLTACVHRTEPAKPPTFCRGGVSLLDAPIVTSDPKATGPIARVAVAGLDDPTLTASLAADLHTAAGQRLEDAPIGSDLRALWHTGLLSDARVDIAVGPDGNAVTFVVAPHPIVESVTIAGVPRTSPELRRLVWLQGTPFDPARVRRTVDTIEEAYRTDGHPDATIQVVRQRHGLCFDVDRGPRIVVGEIRVPGAHAVRERDLVGLLTTKRGQPFNQETFERDELVVADAYWNRGYLGVRVGEPTIQRVGDTLAIAIPVTEGPRYVIGDARFTGLLHGPVTTLRRGEVATQGRIAGPKAWLETIFGPAARVIVRTPRDTAHQTVDITYEVTWREFWESWP